MSAPQPAGFGEPICGFKVVTTERYYCSRTGWVEEPREWTCTRERHEDGPHVAHADDRPVLVWYGVGSGEPFEAGLRLVR